MEKESINKEIEKILQSGKKAEKIKVSPFFTTRMMARIENMEVNNNFFTSFQLNSIIKPALIVLLIVNLMNLYLFRENTNTNTTSSNTQLTQAEHEYLYTSNDFIYNEELLTQN